MLTIAVHAQKGGSGKTTITAHLAAQAAKAGRRVLAVDLDPQESLRKWWDRRAAGDIALAVSPDPAALAATAQAGGYDLVVIDTPPRSAASTLAAMTAADLILIPCRPSIVDVDALDKVTDLVARSRTGQRHAVVLNLCPSPRGVMQADPAIVADCRAAIETQYGLTVAAPFVCDRAAFRHAMNDGSAVVEFEPSGKAAAEVAALWTYIQDRTQ